MSCALDLLAYLDKSGVLGTTSDIDISHTLEPYTEAWDDRVSGWVLNLSIIQAYVYDYCNVPMSGNVSSGSVCPDVVIYNSDGSILSRIPAGGSYTISVSSVTVTDNLANPPTIEVNAGDDYTCTLISEATCAQLNNSTNGLTMSQRQLIQAVYDVKTGQTTSYRDGDDGFYEFGRGASFSTLGCNNPFGNTNRFTDELGGQDYTNNLVIDWLTGLMWYRVVFSIANWNNSIDAAEASSQAGYTNWFIPNISQLGSLINYSLSDFLNYSPFNIDQATYANLWSSTTNPGTTSNAYRLQLSNASTSPLAKTNSTFYIISRNFSFSDLGL